MESLLTIPELLKKNVENFPSRRAIFVPGKFVITYSQLDQLVARAAVRLLHAGICPHDVVALAFPNTVELVIMLLAVIRVRAVAALPNLNDALNFEFYLSNSQSKLLLTPINRYAAAQTAVKLKILHSTVTLTSVNSDFTLSLTLPESESNSDNSLASIINDPSDDALFLHTSGTTNIPKWVPLSQLNLVSSVKNIIKVYKLTEFDSTVIVLPLFNAHGLIGALLSSLCAGASATLPAARRFSKSTFWAEMKRSNATWYTAVPEIHCIILGKHLRKAIRKPKPEYPGLRFIGSCSKLLSPLSLNLLKEAFGAPVLESFGLTEATHLICSNPLPEDGPQKPGSVGRPVGQTVVILDENGVIQGPKCIGEVCIRGPNVTKGYKNNPEVNKSEFLSGWFRTGYVGFFDKDGYLILADRIKELINRKEYNLVTVRKTITAVGRNNIDAVSFIILCYHFGIGFHGLGWPNRNNNLNHLIDYIKLAYYGVLYFLISCSGVSSSAARRIIRDVNDRSPLLSGAALLFMVIGIFWVLFSSLPAQHFCCLVFLCFFLGIYMLQFEALCLKISSRMGK